ncbi:MAG: divergent PAP2 family protein [Patescibacteria group bacterium]|jgi:acid phosphatase family membrane protein YuiD|nr:divergent PAP2 family protein [Patescibacteria group bacterium]
MTSYNDSFLYLLAPFLGWILAQTIKLILTLRKDGISWGDSLQSGGMPSSHTAFMVSISTIIGINFGFTSALFALAISVTAIIIYDALGVRRTTGEQTDAIRKLSKKINIKVDLTNDARGHNPLEIMGGVAVGLFVGTVLSLFL